MHVNRFQEAGRCSRVGHLQKTLGESIWNLNVGLRMDVHYTIGDYPWCYQPIKPSVFAWKLPIKTKLTNICWSYDRDLQHLLRCHCQRNTPEMRARSLRNSDSIRGDLLEELPILMAYKALFVERFRFGTASFTACSFNFYCLLSFIKFCIIISIAFVCFMSCG